jgi:metallo-beta-lactamase family protein
MPHARHRPAPPQRSPKRRKSARPKIDRPQVALLRFLGATGTVTGSRFLIDTPHARVLVDCGLFQGLKALRERNWAQFPIDSSSLDAIVLTHAHLDHSGYIPALTRNGFAGPVYATEHSRDLCRIVLPDSGHLQEEEAAYANRRGYSKHRPALPLYTEVDAERSLGNFQTVPYDTAREVAPGIRATFRPAGHILGSSVVTLEIDGTPTRTVVFSGDLGRPHHPILRPPAAPPAADVILTEGTYGDREHEDEASLQRFEQAITTTAARGGVVVIPSFAVDRTEVILFHLRRLVRAGKVPNLPVFVDSPMALATLQVYRSALSHGAPEVNAELCVSGAEDPFDPGHLIEAKKVEESIAINREQGPAIIISASGMATGGRVLHHLVNRLPEARNTVLLVGYQAEGTRGRSLLEGAKTLKLLGRYVPVRADVVNVPAFSVHADRSEILAWLRSAPRAPEITFVVHAEPSAAQTLHDSIESELGWHVAVPRYLEQVRID